MSSKGHFITLEGGEGAGKSTLLTSLSQVLAQRGYEVVVTREPGGTSLGEAVRTLLLQQQSAFTVYPETELLLFLAARAQHIQEVILPALAAGKIVLCDRFNDSTIAYQGAARGLGIAHVQQLCRLVCGKVAPELTLFLSISPKVGIARTQSVHKEHAAGGELDRIESEALEFHEKIQQTFQKLAKKEPFRIYTIDATLSPAEVLKEAIRAIDELILLPNHSLQRNR